MTVAKRTKRPKPNAELMQLADSLLVNYKKPEDLIGENGLLKQLTKMLVERALEAEMADHLGHDKSDPVTNVTGNARNGHSAKTLKGEFGELPLDIPRDRQGAFEPQLIGKHQTRWTGFDDKIISLYARGMTVREIQGHLTEMYGTEVSPSLISAVTDAVSEEVKAWQARPLDPLYPILYLDCIHIKVRDTGAVRVKAVYLAIGVNFTGHKEVLGLWIAQTEGAKFWLQVVTELKNRGVQDIFIACVDGLKGFPEAIETVYPKASVQLCIVHMVRNSLNFVSWKTRKEVAADLRLIYQSATVDDAEQRLTEFEGKWDSQHPPIPGGHFKFPHLWPGQTPPGGTTGMDGLLLGLVSLCKAVGGFFEPVAFAAEFDEDTAVQEAVQNGGGQRGVAKEFVPIFHDPV